MILCRSQCEFDNLLDFLIKDITVCGTRDNSLLEWLCRECHLTQSKAISACHAAEETPKHAREILNLNLPPTLIRFLKGNSLNSIRTQQALYFAAQVLIKKYMKLKRMNLMDSPTTATMNFLLKLLIFKTLHLLTKSRMKNLISQ